MERDRPGRNQGIQLLANEVEPSVHVSACAWAGVALVVRAESLSDNGWLGAGTVAASHRYLSSLISVHYGFSTDITGMLTSQRACNGDSEVLNAILGVFWRGLKP